MNTFDVFGVCFIVLFLWAIAWVLLRGNPATDIEKAELIEACLGDLETEKIVRLALQKKHLQKADCFHLLKRIKYIHDSKRAEAVISTFSNRG